MDHIEALLYEHAPRAWELWLNTLPDRDEVPGHTFSRRFERRMAQLLRRQRVCLCKRLCEYGNKM